jgi:hypothetical protein
MLHGLWNYNPSAYDMTQAYTNPVYAFLSIIPAFFHIDVVLFFKITSVIIIGLFSGWYIGKAKDGLIVILAAFSIPMTMIHAFSGLETILFCILVTILLIAIYEDSFRGIIASSALLFYTRPESLTLLVIIPLLYCNWQSAGYKKLLNKDTYSFCKFFVFSRNFITRKSLFVFLLLFFLLLPNFIISYLNFHTLLPNTFFIKNGTFNFGSIGKLLQYSLALFPLIISFRFIPIKKWLSMTLFFAFIVVQYSKTAFSMDYAMRSIYHIFFPVVFFVFYLCEKQGASTFILISDSVSHISFKASYKRICVCITLIVVLFFLKRTDISELVHLSNYYSRAISAHADAGKMVNAIKTKYDIKAIACGDAGMLAFQADIDSLDLYSLSSAALTRQGFQTTYDLYQPDILFLHGNEKVREGIFEEIKNAGAYIYLGKITWTVDYFLWIYAKKDIPEFADICEKSNRINNRRERQVLKEHIFSPPWKLWHE